MKSPTNRPFEEITAIPLFNRMDRMDVRRLVDVARQKQVQAGEFFFFQGDAAESMYILLQGRVKLHQAGQDGKKALIRVIRPVHLFGLVAMTTYQSYPVSAQAARDSLALFWDRNELVEYVKGVPEMALNAMHIMAQQLEEMQNRFLQATTQVVERRLASTLMRLASQEGVSVEQGILIDLALTRQDLAEMSGTTLYTASRMLNRWQAQDLVVSGRGKVILCNPNGLARIIEETMV